MLRWLTTTAALGFLVTFAAFPSSTSYKLNSYSLSPGGTNSASSTTYKTQATIGEQTNGSGSSTTYKIGSGQVQTEQLSKPLAPTLSNGSGTYYNQLNCVIVTTNLPSDATYAIAVSSTSSTMAAGSYNYVQSNGTLGATAVYKTYSQWGGSSGTFITGLVENTTYYVEIAAKQGMFTNTDITSTDIANKATVGSTISFSVSPNSATLSTLTPGGSIVTSSNLSFTFATNATSGGEVYVSGKNSGFLSSSTSYTISAFTGDLSGQTQGFGLQATNPSQTSGGPLSTVSPFNGSGNTIGAESTTFQEMLSSSASIVGGSANANVQARAGITAAPAADYNEVFTFIAAANF